MWLHPNSWDHDLNKLEYILPEDDSKQVSGWLVSEKRSIKIYSIYLYVKVHPLTQLLPHPTTGGYGLNKIKSTLPKDADVHNWYFIIRDSEIVEFFFSIGWYLGPY